ncbi:MAG: hypothetical protein ACLQM8_20690 [Limisphaerales bacterium]
MKHAVDGQPTLPSASMMKLISQQQSTRCASGVFTTSACLLVALLLSLPRLCKGGEVPTPAAPGKEIARRTRWTCVSLSGGGGMFTPAISPADPNLVLVNCDMSGVAMRSRPSTSFF